MATIYTKDDGQLLVAGSGVAYHVDRTMLLDAYRELRRIIDADPNITGFMASVAVFDMLRATNDVDTARRHSWAARFVYENGLDPETGRKLTGIAAVHPKLAEAAATEIQEVLA
jgi:hypothetical protein